MALTLHVKPSFVPFLWKGEVPEAPMGLVLKAKPVAPLLLLAGLNGVGDAIGRSPFGFLWIFCRLV